MNREFAPSSTATRSVLAVAAVVITASIGGFIDHLATDYASAPYAAQATAKSTVALAARR